LKALGRKRGPKPKRTAEQIEVEKLRRENERLREKLRKAEKIVPMLERPCSVQIFGRSVGIDLRKSKS
jgi:hypothetical protein